MAASMILTRDDFKDQSDGYHLNVFDDIVECMKCAGFKVDEKTDSIIATFEPSILK